MVRTAGSDTTRGRKFYRLVLQTLLGRNCLVAIEIGRQDNLPALMDGVAKVIDDLGTARVSLIFRPVATIVKLDQRSLSRFDELLAHRNAQAFNDKAFDAKFHSARVNEKLSTALNDPMRFGRAPEVAACCANLFVHDAKNAGKSRSNCKALFITYEARPVMPLLVTVISILLVTMLLEAALAHFTSGVCRLRIG